MKSIASVPIVLLLFLYSSLAIGDSVPSWVQKPAVEDSAHRYYVGRASGKSSDSEKYLFDQATQDARESAIAENFGVATAIEKQAYTSLEKDSSVQRISEISKRISLKGFQRVDQYIENKDGTKQLWVYYKYAKAEILKEQRRLESIVTNDLPPEFSEVTATTGAGGFLALTTTPLGSSVTIDNQSYGLSPVKVKLAAGVHRIFVDHEFFDHVEEEVVIVEGKTIRLNRILTRANRAIRINSQPDRASVTLAGKYIGQTPLQTVVPTGEKLSLLITHPETQAYRTEVEVGKSPDTYELNVPPLILKPSFASINSIPQGADVYLNSKYVGKTPTGFIEATSGELILKKDGYLDYEGKVQLHGGQRLVLPTINLSTVSEEEKKLEKLKADYQDHLDRWPLVVGLGFAFYGATFESYRDLSSAALELSLEKKLYGLVGVKLSGAFLATDETTGTDGSAPARKMDGSLYKASVPIYVGNFYLSPSHGIVKQEISCKTVSAQCQNLSLKQTFVGGSLGFQKFWQQLGVDASYGVFKYSDDGVVMGKSSGAFQISLVYRF